MLNVTASVTFTREELVMARDVVHDKLSALHNHIATGVEIHAKGRDAGALDPTKLVIELRKHQAIFAKLNGAILRMDGIIS